ncbi:hypothetical protein ACWIGW_22190 [Nocardia brasiliensis]
MRAIKFEPNYVYRYGPDNRSSVAIGPFVSFVLGDVQVVLTVSDARDLLEALPYVLAQSDYAEFLAGESRAVA